MSVTLTDLLAVLTLGAACWALRATFVLMLPADRLPPVVSRALQYLAPAALASICGVELTDAAGSTDQVGATASVAIVVIAGAVALWSRSMTWAVLAGIVGVLLVDLAVLPS